MDRPDSDTPTRRAPARPTVDLDPTDVVAFLRRHPDFLYTRPDLAASLRPPPRDLGRGVVDLQHFLLERLRVDLARLKLNQRKLIATSRNNLTSQGRVHEAVLALLAADSFEHLISVIVDELTLILDIDAIGLCLETGEQSPTQLVVGNSSVQILPAGLIDELLEGQEVQLRSDVTGDTRLFAGGAGLVRSDALVRLRFSPDSPPGLLALGARRPGIYHPGQGTELIGFLAKVIELSVRSWLDLPG